MQCIRHVHMWQALDDTMRAVVYAHNRAKSCLHALQHPTSQTRTWADHTTTQTQTDTMRAVVYVHNRAKSCLCTLQHPTSQSGLSQHFRMHRRTHHAKQHGIMHPTWHCDNACTNMSREDTIVAYRMDHSCALFENSRDNRRIGCLAIIYADIAHRVLMLLSPQRSMSCHVYKSIILLTHIHKQSEYQTLAVFCIRQCEACTHTFVCLVSVRMNICRVLHT